MRVSRLSTGACSANRQTERILMISGTTMSYDDPMCKCKHRFLQHDAKRKPKSMVPPNARVPVDPYRLVCSKRSCKCRDFRDAGRVMNSLEER